jgi:hypothetical protein
VQKDDVLKLWGNPTTFEDIAQLFSKFCLGQLSALPWSDQAPARETTVIAKQLSQINEMGFLTINSQPAVDGAKSEDKAFGWGPANGYVYQKAYLEFFVNPTLLSLLLPTSNGIRTLLIMLLTSAVIFVRTLIRMAQMLSPGASSLARKLYSPPLSRQSALWLGK